MEGKAKRQRLFIYAPAYTDKSNGIRILYSLCRYIDSSGLIESHIACCERPRTDTGSVDGKGADIIASSKVRISDDDIVLYPETVAGNPMVAKKVVRYLMNRPWKLSGRGVDYGESDFLVSYSALVDPALPNLLIMNDEPLVRKFRGRGKTGKTLVFFGKTEPTLLRQKYEVVKEALADCGGVDVITRLHPERREDYFETLAESKAVISFDSLSNVNYESLLLGTPVWLLNDEFGLTEGKFNLPLRGLTLDWGHIGEARSGIERTYQYFDDYLKQQGDIVKEFCGGILRHFTRIDSDPSYAALCRSVNKERHELDRLRFERDGGRATVNIDYPEQLPRVYRELLSIEGGCRVRRGKDPFAIVRPVESNSKTWIKQNIIIPLCLEGVFSIFFRRKGLSLVLRFQKTAAKIRENADLNSGRMHR